MSRWIVLSILLLNVWNYSLGKQVEEESSEPVVINWFVEAYPAFYGLGNLKGVALSVHRSIPCFSNVTAGVGVRYYDGVKPEEDRPGELDITSPRTVSVEVFPRYWLIDRFYSIYIGALAGIHYTFKPYIGIGVGGYLNIVGPVYLSGALYIQSRSVEQGAEPLFPRFFGGLAIRVK